MTELPDQHAIDNPVLKTRKEGEDDGVRTAMIGCGVVVVICVALLIAGGVLFAYFGKNWAADVAIGAIIRNVEVSELSAGEKERITERLRQLSDDFTAGRITPEQLLEIRKKLGDRPIVLISILRNTFPKYVVSSGLSDEEKQAAKRILQRFERGSVEMKITKTQYADALYLLQATHGGYYKEVLTDTELRAFLKQLSVDADDAEVPDEPFEFDIAGELESAIDSVLNPASPPKLAPENR